MKKHSQSHFYWILLLTIGLILPGCQKRDQSKSEPEAGSAAPVLGQPTNGTSDPAAPAAGSGAPTANGTGDFSGGNGYNGVSLESYRVDIEKLPAFQKHLKRKFESLNKGGNQAEAEKKVESRLFNFKSWFVAPMQFKPLENEALGLTFTNDHMQQLAIQTSTAIWINKEFFEKMTTEQQADLLAHEILESLYLFRFEEGMDLCQKIMPPEIPCGQIMKMPPWNEKPEAKRPLKGSDYENIRAATVWFLLEEESVKIDEFNRKLHTLNFDPRFFRGDDSSASGPYKKEPFKKELDRLLSPADILSLVKNGLQSELFEQNCLTNLGGKELSVPCRFQFSMTEVPKGQKVEWSFAGDLNLKSEFHFVNQFTGAVTWTEPEGRVVELHDINMIGGQLNVLPLQDGQRYFTMLAIIEKSTSMNVLSAQIQGIVFYEKVFHGIRASGPVDQQSWCPEVSFVLDPAGKRKFIILKAKNTKFDSFLLEMKLDHVCQIGTPVSASKPGPPAVEPAK